MMCNIPFLSRFSPKLGILGVSDAKNIGRYGILVPLPPPLPPWPGLKIDYTHTYIMSAKTVDGLALIRIRFFAHNGLLTFKDLHSLKMMRSINFLVG